MLTLAQAIIAHFTLILLLIASLRVPFVGILGYYWLAFNFPLSSIPFAPGIPWLQIIVLCILLGMISGKKEVIPVFPRPMGFFIVFWSWTAVTTIFAMNAARAPTLLFDFTQVLLVSILAVFIINTEEKLKYLVITFVFSLIPHTTEVGVVGLLAQSAKTGYGLRESFFNSENQMARIIIIIIPYLYFLYLHLHTHWVRFAALGALGLNILSLVTTGSRGGFVAFAAMGGYYWLLSRRKIRISILGAVGIVALFAALPEARRNAWLERMNTIENREEDGSYNERLRAWAWAVDLANSRPFVGGGFGAFGLFVDARSSGAIMQREAHSNYFEMIGTHGYMGLALYLSLGVAAFVTAVRTARKATWHPELFWARDLMHATQVALIGYFVGGLTITHAFWQPYYLLLVFIAATKHSVDRFTGASIASGVQAAASGSGASRQNPIFAARR